MMHSRRVADHGSLWLYFFPIVFLLVGSFVHYSTFPLPPGGKGPATLKGYARLQALNSEQQPRQVVDDASFDSHHGGGGGRRRRAFVMVGTDGSGTRVVATIMEKLGVGVIVHDHKQMDVDGRTSGVHFTEMIQEILARTGRLDYSLDDLPRTLRIKALTRIEHFVDVLRAESNTLGERRAVVGGEGGKGWGFKAPHFMNLLPFFEHVLGDELCVVHIIRDGRDLAFSKNQAPVTKYLEHLIPGETGAKKGTPEFMLQAVRMWAKQNSDVAQWGDAASSRRGARRCYVPVRVEVLSDPGCALADYRRLARAVGSDLNDRDLCELAASIRKRTLGSHDKAGANIDRGVPVFGKWLQHGGAARALTDVGRGTLAHFNYSIEIDAAERAFAQSGGWQAWSDGHWLRRDNCTTLVSGG